MLPEWMTAAWLRIKAVFRRPKLDRDLEDELQFHLAMREQKLVGEGVPPNEARYAARREFGSATRAKESNHEMWTFPFLETLWQDVRYGLRQLRRNPGFTAVAVITLALGIGANTAIFSVVNTVLLRPLAYPNAGRLIWLTNYDPQFRHDTYISRADYVIWKSQAHSLESMTAYGDQDLSLMTEAGAAEARIVSITGDFWSITGAHPVLGRLFRPGEPHTMVLSYGLFERRFGSDPHIIGRTLTVDGYPFSITGVLSKDFRFLFPQQLALGAEPRRIDAYIPIPNAVETPGEIITQNRGPAPPWVCVVGKLRSRVPIATARAQMETIYARIAREYPTPLRKVRTLRVVPLQGKLVGSVRPALMVLLGAVGFVLLIACGNITNLLLARASTRQREIAIRAAIGAGRVRLIRQFLAESVLMALLGGVAGLLLARCALVIIVRLGSEIIPRVGQAAIDARVLAFTLGVSLATGLLFGLAPALSFSRGNLHDALNDNARLSYLGAGRLRVRGLMVAAELALTIALLTGAGLMLKSFWRMNTYPPGFAPAKIVVMRVPLSGPQYNVWVREDAYIQQLMLRIKAIPGVQAVGVDRATLNIPFNVEGAPASSPDRRPIAAFRAVSPGFLRALGVPLLKGRWPRSDESFDDFVVNESFAREIFGKGDAIGGRIKANFLEGTIVGVIADFKYWKLDAESSPAVFFPYQLSPVGRSVRVVVRTQGDPKAIASMIRKVASGIDPTQPFYDFQTLQQALSGSIAPRRFNLFLLVAFAAVALVMALVGIHGVMSYSVSQRTHEIGIRMALGAQRGDVLRMVLKQGLALAVTGVGVGVAAAFALTRFLSSLLYGVRPTDPATFAAVSVVLIAVALLACYIPARRAAKVDPVVALRYE